MLKKFKILKSFPFILASGMTIIFIVSFIRGSSIVKKSEKELNPGKQISEAQAAKYSLKEVDTKTGQLRWQLTAKEGSTEENLQAALIKDITAEVYKNNEVVFELSAPFARANASTKEIYLFGEVTATDKSGNFLLNSTQIALGMGTSIEAQKGFNLLLKGSGTVSGESALINDDQTKIIVKELKEATFKDIILSGEKVLIEKDQKGNLTSAIISEGGKIIFKDKKDPKNQANNTLSGNTIKWQKQGEGGEVEASDNVVYTSEDKIFKAGYLLLKPDKKIYAKNNVTILHGQTQCYGNDLKFENNSFIVLSGNPKAIQGNKQITADKIVYDINTEKVEATGNVKTIVTNNTKEKI